MGDQSAAENHMFEQSVRKKMWVKKSGRKTVGEDSVGEICGLKSVRMKNGGRWDAGFRSPILRCTIL